MLVDAPDGRASGAGGPAGGIADGDRDGIAARQGRPGAAEAGAAARPDQGRRRRAARRGARLRPAARLREQGRSLRHHRRRGGADDAAEARQFRRDRLRAQSGSHRHVRLEHAEAVARALQSRPRFAGEGAYPPALRDQGGHAARHLDARVYPGRAGLLELLAERRAAEVRRHGLPARPHGAAVQSRSGRQPGHSRAPRGGQPVHVAGGGRGRGRPGPASDLHPRLYRGSDAARRAQGGGEGRARSRPDRRRHALADRHGTGRGDARGPGRGGARAGRLLRLDAGLPRRLPAPRARGPGEGS